MNRHHSSARLEKRLALLLVLALATLGIAGRAEVATNGRCVLLVGVTTYPNYASLPELEGPANDVVLMRKLLHERYGFPDKGVA